MYPVVGGTTINAAAYNSRLDLEDTPLSEANIPLPSLEDLNANYVGWEKEVQDLLKVALPVLIRTMGLIVEGCGSNPSSLAGLITETFALLCKGQSCIVRRCSRWMLAACSSGV